MQIEHGVVQVVRPAWERNAYYKIRMKPQTWLITGATGLIGQALTQQLLDKGHVVHALGRTAHGPEGSTPFQWDPQQGVFPTEALEGVQVVVHLAAASVGQRWTASHKKAIMQSRVQGTALLRDVLEASGFQGTWIQASAIGIYGNHPAACDETTPAGKGFLAEVAQSWEAASQPETQHSFRQIRMRLGLVLAPQGGTLDKLRPIYNLGLGAPLGSGQQPMGWVHLTDVLQFITWAADTPDASGAYNVVAPQPATNQEFSRTLARAMARPHWAPNVPAFALKIAMGEMASLLLEGQHAMPQRLLDAKFPWTHPLLYDALRDCVA